MATLENEPVKEKKSNKIKSYSIAFRPEKKVYFSLKKEARERGLSMNQLVLEILKGRKAVMA